MSKAGGAGDSTSFELSRVRRLLGGDIADLIESISREAQERDLPLYLAGGVARDLLLGRQTLDLDLVVVGDATRFAKSLAERYGGKVMAHEQFGTAKWRLDAELANELSLALEALPASVDLVTARGESYTHPAALPTVSPGDIRRDLRRRDFGVNALAIQLSPRRGAGALLDLCGGLEDLKRRRIRALHDQSFVDDPTRILRALRYARRLGFQLERRTGEWMRAALPLLGRVSGQRLRNDIDLILREDGGGEVALALQDLGALRHIHRAFRVSRRLPALLTLVSDCGPPWPSEALDIQSRRWHALLAGVPVADLPSLCDRLALTKALSRSIIASARLLERASRLEAPDMRPSQIARILDEFPDSALQAGWLLWEGQAPARERIAAYASDWRQGRAQTSGKDLIAMGIAPGPLYRQILARLRFARMDGEAHSLDDEIALLRRFLDSED